MGANLRLQCKKHRDYKIEIAVPNDMSGPWPKCPKCKRNLINIPGKKPKDYTLSFAEL